MVYQGIIAMAYVKLRNCYTALNCEHQLRMIFLKYIFQTEKFGLCGEYIPSAIFIRTHKKRQIEIENVPRS